MASNLLFLVLGILFAFQLILCFAGKRWWIRILPLAVTALADIICWVMYFGGCFSETYGASFAFYIYGILLAVVLCGEGAAWAVYGIVKLVQKRRK